MRSIRLSFWAIPSTYSCIRRVVDYTSTLFKRRACRFPFEDPPSPRTERFNFHLHDFTLSRDHNIVFLQVYPALCSKIWTWGLSNFPTTTPFFHRRLSIWSQRLWSGRVILISSLRLGRSSTASFMTNSYLVSPLGVSFSTILPCRANKLLKWLSDESSNLPHKWQLACQDSQQKRFSSSCAHWPDTHGSVPLSKLSSKMTLQKCFHGTHTISSSVHW